MLNVLDRSLQAGGPNGNAWRQYLRFDELKAQMDGNGQPDPTLLKLALERFSSDEAGLKLAVFANVGRALDDYIAELSRWESAVQLQQREQRTATENGVGTKINRSIDRARELIASGNWREASAELAPELLSGDRRTQAMATLYSAVIMAESGLGTEAAAGATFEQAIGMLADGDIADRYRAHNNFANFLMNQAQDRLHNHTFQMAAGVRQPITTALQLWIVAEEHYRIAFELARKVNVNQQSATQVNLARLYSLLGDVIRTLDVSSDRKRQFTAGEEAADRVAQQFAPLC